jgi:DNA-binding MarR family transcriptional regulator
VDEENQVQLALERFAPYRLNRAAELVSQQFARIYRDHSGLTRPEWRALATLGQYSRMTATEIGLHSSMHKTKVSRAVQALQDRGWLKRETDPDDRRVEHLFLTRQGEYQYRALARLAFDFEAQLRTLIGNDAFQRLDAGLSAIETTMCGEKADRKSPG